MKQGSCLLALDLLSQLENQRLQKEKINSILWIGDIWVPSNITVLDVVLNFTDQKWMHMSKLGIVLWELRTQVKLHIYCVGFILRTPMVECVGGMQGGVNSTIISKLITIEEG
jgi:hypothetical protein